MENNIASKPAADHAGVLPAQLQNARARKTPQTKMILRAVQYFRLIAFRTAARRPRRAICLLSCSNRVMRSTDYTDPCNLWMFYLMRRAEWDTSSREERRRWACVRC